MARRLRNVVLDTWLVVAVVAIWWVASDGSTSPFHPSLQRIAETLWTEISDGPILSELAYSATNLGYGLAISIVLGIAFGVVLGSSELLYLAFSPLIEFMRALPKVALIPLFVGILSLGASSKVAIIVLACVWPILIGTVDGIRGIDPALIDIGRSYRIPRWLRLSRLVIPAASPQIISATRVSLSIGVVVVVISEIFGAEHGIGHYIVQAQRAFEVPETWAGTLVVAASGYLLNVAFTVFERRYLAWYIHSSGTLSREGRT
jgi:sulfonate transport system permease protein